MGLNQEFKNPKSFWAFALGVSLLTTVMSISMTGFSYGVVNNVFHVPYVLNLANDPVFAGNAFYQSLENFTSIIWPVVRFFSNEENIQWVFFITFALGRFVAILGVSYLLHVNGLKKPLWLLVATMLFTTTVFFQGSSPVGGNGQFHSYLAHSELTWGSIFFAFAFLQQRRVLMTTLMISFTFLINVFIGIWIGFIGLVSALFFKQPITIPNTLKAAVIFTIVSSPVLWWVGQSVGNAEPVDFSYIEYIRSYFKYHFLIEGAKPTKIIVLLSFCIAGFLAAHYTPARKYWIGIQVGWLILFVVGAILPYLFNNRFVFNMHFLRADGIEQSIAVCLMVYASIQLLKNEESQYCRILGLIALVSMTSIILNPIRYADFLMAVIAVGTGLLYMQKDLPAYLGILLKPFANRMDTFSKLTIAVFILLNLSHFVTQDIHLYTFLRLALVCAAFAVCFDKFPKIISLKNTNILAILCVLMMVLTTAIVTIKRMDGYVLSDRFEEPSDIASKNESSGDDWKNLMAQIRESDMQGVFLIPVRNYESGFQLFARRPVWVDWRQGAAVMWSPSFFKQWDTRYKDVSALKTNDEIIRYAQDNNIENIVVKTQENQCEAPYEVKLTTENYVACSAR